MEWERLVGDDVTNYPQRRKKWNRTSPAFCGELVPMNLPGKFSSVVLIGLAWLLALALPTPAAAQESTPAVRLTVDYGDGVQKTFTAVAWKQGQTVFHALQAAAKHPHGIKVEHQGSGETTFISAIDDCANEGSGGRNWRFSVNDRPAQMSCGVTEIKAGDSIVWHFKS